MTADRWPVVLGLVAWLMLVGAGLARRRLGGRAYVRLALVWLAIILATWTAVDLILRHASEFT